jgi:hypothetical protein
MKKYLSVCIKCLLLGSLLLTYSCYRKGNNHFLEEKQDDWFVIESEEPGLDLSQLEEFEDSLAELFAEHGRLFNEAILTILYQNSEEAIQEKESALLENSHEIASLISLAYGIRIGQRFKELFNHQIELGSAYIKAIKNQQLSLAYDLSHSNRKNGDMMAQFLSLINPFFPSQVERLMFEEYLTLEIDQIQAYFDGHLNQAEELKERSINQLREIATHLSKAIIKQLIDSQSIDSAAFSNF